VLQKTLFVQVFTIFFSFLTKLKKLSPNFRPFTNTYVYLIRLRKSWWFWRIASALLHLAIHWNKGISLLHNASYYNVVNGRSSREMSHHLPHFL